MTDSAPQPRRTFHLPAARKRRNWGEGMKRCPACRQIKPLTEFHRCANRYDGVVAFCRSCLLQKQYRQKARRNDPIRQAVVAVLTAQGPLRPDELGAGVRQFLDDPSISAVRVCHVAVRSRLVERRGKAGKGGQIWSPIYALPGQGERVTRPRKTLYQVRIGEDAEHLAWMAEMRQRTQQRTLRAQA